MIMISGFGPSGGHDASSSVHIQKHSAPSSSPHAQEPQCSEDDESCHLGSGSPAHDSE